MGVDVKEVLSELEALVRAGRGRKVRSLVIQLSASRYFPTSKKALLANIARRVGLPYLGAHILHNQIRSKFPIENISTEDRAEYAVCLLHMGCRKEAIELLETVEPKQFPEVLLYRSFAAFDGWAYAKAIPLLEFYISIQTDSYKQTVGKVNLAAAYVHCGIEPQAGTCLGELRTTIDRRFTLLHGNILELSAQHAIRKRQWDLAKRYLEEAETKLGEMESLDQFFVRKWKSILTLCMQGNTRSSINQIQSVRTEAGKRGHWETQRDLDFWKASILSSRQLFRHLYAGTPFLEYRQKILSLCPDAEATAYVWNLNKRSYSKIDIDLVDGVGTPRVGLGCFRLLNVLTSDFYRPFSLGALFSQTYPGEYFSPFSSPTRIHHLTKRLRAWIEERNLPLAVIEERGFYRLGAFKSVSIRVNVGSSPNLSGDLNLSRLKRYFESRGFSAAEASKQLGVSHRFIQRLFRTALQDGILVPIGGGPRIKYRFVTRR